MGRVATRLLTVTALSGALALVGSPALAQKPAPAQKTPAAAPAAAPAPASAPAKPAPARPESSDPTERARVHYERGLQLFNEENYDAALFEFDRAYELAPSYKILYNMGRIQRQQNNYAAAMRSYTRYLREGGAAVPEDRRKEVEAEIAVLKPRVAHVKVTVNVDAADVYADDIPVCTATIESSCVGKSPLQAPIIVNGGRHKITATKKGYAPATALVSVVGSDEISVKLDLVSYDRPTAPPPNAWVTPTIAGWSATGVAAITGTVFGILALGAKDDQEAKLKEPNATAEDLTNARDKTQTLSGVSDILFITTGVFAIASTYFTIRMIRSSNKEGTPAPPAAAARLDLRVAPTGLAAVGTF